jgi:membrane protein YqaA with SNARE-associated domain
MLIISTYFMSNLFESIAEYSYAGIFLLLVGVNAAPLLMPPTWIILSSFFVLDQSFDPIVLSLVGATGATIGRFLLKIVSGYFRNVVGNQQKTNLDSIGNFLNQKKFGYIISSFLFAATPLPSNMLFIAYGLMRAKSFGLYLGFWLGRVISYYIMISISKIVLIPFIELFEDRYIGILVADALGIGLVIFFTCIDWNLLLISRKFKLVKPRLWRL